MRRQIRALILLGLLFGISVAVVATPRIHFSFLGSTFERGNKDTPLGLTLGLDLQGGTHLVYRAVRKDGGKPSVEDMQGVRQILESRVNQFGLSEPTVQLLGTPPDRVLIQLPGLKGASITIAFEGDTVPPEKLQEFLRSDAVGHADAVVRQQEDLSLVASFDSLEPERVDVDGNVVKKSEAERLRAKIASEFPPTLTIIYPVGGAAATSTATSTPPRKPPTLDEVRAVLAAIGRPAADVRERSPGTFAVQLPNLVEDTRDEKGNLVPGEIQQIRNRLQERFGRPLVFATAGRITQYTVGGGIQEAKALIGATASLEFRERQCGDLAPPDATTPWPPDGLSQQEWLVQRCSNPRYYSEKAIDISGSDLVDAYAGTQPGIARPVVNIRFDDKGAKEFFKVTDRISRTHGLLAIYLDGKELVAPSAQQGIAGGRAFIQGPDFTPERTRTIAIQLRSGALPVDLELVQERNVDATLGADSLRKSVIAGAVGLGIVFAYMILYYKAQGGVAAIALLLYAGILLAVFKIAPVTLTLSGVAALILSIGTAVDANVLIAERIKEELRTGRTLFASIAEGFDRAWPSIRDSNVSTIITCLVLFWFGDRLGTSIMQGFALTLAAGTLVSMFTAFFATRVIMRSIASTPIGRRLTLYVPVGDVGVEASRLAEG